MAKFASVKLKKTSLEYPSAEEALKENYEILTRQGHTVRGWVTLVDNLKNLSKASWSRTTACNGFVGAGAADHVIATIGHLDSAKEEFRDWCKFLTRCGFPMPELIEIEDRLFCHIYHTDRIIRLAWWQALRYVLPNSSGYDLIYQHIQKLKDSDLPALKKLQLAHFFNKSDYTGRGLWGMNTVPKIFKKSEMNQIFSSVENSVVQRFGRQSPQDISQKMLKDIPKLTPREAHRKIVELSEMLDGYKQVPFVSEIDKTKSKRENRHFGTAERSINVTLKAIKDEGIFKKNQRYLVTVSERREGYAFCGSCRQPCSDKIPCMTGNWSTALKLVSSTMTHKGVSVNPKLFKYSELFIRE